MTAPKATHPALYRSYQFFTALKAYLPVWAGGTRGQLTAADESLVAVILTTPPQRQLFNRMSPNDRRHALAVARALQQAGQIDPALLQAALLHDVAKSLGQPILHRVTIVLLEAFWPAALKWLSTDTQYALPKGYDVRNTFFRPFVIHAHHAAIGATWAAESGCDPLAARLIARHQEKLSGGPVTVEDRLLAVLQSVDNLN